MQLIASKAVSMLILSTAVALPMAQAQINTVIQRKPFLFEIQKDGKVSHILGSAQVGMPLQSYPQKALDAAARAKSFAAMTDLTALPADYQVQMANAAAYPAGDSLEKNISPAAVAKLKQMVGEAAFATLNKYKPWFVMLQIEKAGFEKLKKDGTPNMWGVDSMIDVKLIADAKKASKPMVMLDDNINKFKNNETDVTAQDLEKLLTYPQPVAHVIMCFQAQQAAYISGDEKNFKIYNNGCETSGVLTRLQQRTLSWIPKLEPLLKQGGAFAVVGADHMHGVNGLEAQLKARGYSVTRIEAYSNPLMVGGGQVVAAPVVRAPVGAGR